MTEEKIVGRGKLAVGVTVGKAIIAFLFASLLVAGLGLYSDLVWHQNTPFESFWTPAHATLYGGMIGVALLLLIAPRVDAWRTIFGNGVRFLRILPRMSYPHPLAIAVLGTATVLVAGALDERWHSILGGGESAYSWPHNLALSGGVILGLAGVSIIDHVKRFSRGLAVFGWIVLSVSWPIVLYRYAGYVRFSYNDLRELVMDEHLAQDPAWLGIMENVIKYNIAGENYLFAPPAIFLVSALFLYVASSIHPLGSGGFSRAIARFPAFSSALIYVLSVLAIDSAIRFMGYRAITPLHVLVSLLAMGLVYDLARRFLADRDPASWAVAIAVGSLIYVWLLSYSISEALIAVVLALAFGVSSIYIGRALLSSIRSLDARFAIYMLILIIAVPLLLGSVDSFLRYEAWFFPPRP